MAKEKAEKKEPKIKEIKVVHSNKEEARQAALTSLNKRFGSGTVFEFSKHPLPNVSCTPSGSISLDVALGGGYPRGRIVEIFGPEASGKCLTKDTYIRTNTGIQTIEELFTENDLAASCTTRVTEKSVTLLNRVGLPERTVKFTNNGLREVSRVDLADGSSITSTHNHPHLTMSPTGNWVWKRTSEISEGDVLLKLRETPQHTEFVSSAYALGCVVADSCLSTDSRVSFTNNDPVVTNVVLTEMQNTFGFAAPKVYPRTQNNTVEYHFNSTEGSVRFREETGLVMGVASSKFIPPKIRNDLASLRSFLMGYVDCESHIDTERTTIEVCSASKKLLSEVQIALLCFGVHSTVFPKPVAKYPNSSYWRLNISGPSYAAYNTYIGFKSDIRKNEYQVKPCVKSTIDLIPNLTSLLTDLYGMSETSRMHDGLVGDYTRGGHSPTYAKLKEILSLDWQEGPVLARLREIAEQHYVYVAVVGVSPAGEEPTFDFEMSETHSFIANGVVTHNTTLTLHAIAEIQKLGGAAAFVDAEHALSPSYARQLGVDMDKLVLSQPDSAEQALTVMEELISSGGFDIVVLDSVAALVPQAELDADMGTAQMGLQARLMSQALRKLTAIADKTNTLIFFINQLRMKIGVMFGSPETTTGGNALKFYASQRLDIRKKEAIKEGDRVVGNLTHVKIIKNKIAPPFREVDFEIYYGKGVSKSNDIATLSVYYNLVEKAGAWYSYQGELIAQGHKKLCAYLEEHPDLMESLEMEIKKQARLPEATTGSQAVPLTEPIVFETEEEIPEDAE